MTPTLAEARADLFALLDGPMDSVDAVYDHEPHRETSGPCYVTVELDSITPREQRWAVRVYSQAADSPEEAAHTLDAAVAAVDDRLVEATVGPSEWQIGYDDNLTSFVARVFVTVQRETF